MTSGAYSILVCVLTAHLPICAFVAVTDGLVFFQVENVFFQVAQTLAVADEIGSQWTEETISDGTCHKI